ncbi:MAG: sterol desaturase family protein [Alphaproteobacteria bacterium]|nr:sterol desaturase family protein [Alphaproteobacteria bacterium]
MNDQAISLFGLSEPQLRLGIFLVVFLVFSALEALFPRRARRAPRLHRWFTNLSMLMLATGLIRALAILAPLLAGVAAAGLSASLGFGLFHLIDAPAWLEIALGVALLDLAIWGQHWATHNVPLLWRLHRVHHADLDLDASSALRFHPVEMVLSAAYKLVIILALGPAAIAVVIFEILLNASAMFNHANLNLPLWLDRILRPIFVTPDMHRIHHSVNRAEHDRNYGFCLSIWDRMLGTYRADPERGQIGMTLGLEPCQDKPTERLSWSLWFPFMR